MSADDVYLQVGWLQPVYATINSFLDALVAPNELVAVMDEYNISRLADIDAEFMGEWQTWSTTHFYGFVVALYLGLSFIVGFPLATCCLYIDCCCCCDYCYRRDDDRVEDIHARRRNLCTIALALLSAGESL